MAKVDINAVTEHFRGKLGDVIFKRLHGRLVASLRPRLSSSPPTGAQESQRLQFSKAASFAKKMLANPATRSLYERVGEEKHQNALATAVGDFFTPPVVHEVNLDAYQGRAGDKIRILAKDDVEVVGVAVVLRLSNGTVIEQGPAVLAFNEWVYTATTTLAPNQQVLIDVTAKDHPGNEGVQSTSYP